MSAWWRDSRILLVALSIACGALVARSCMSGDRYQAFGTPGAIAKFLTTSSIGDSTLSDDGTVTTNTHPFNVPSYQSSGVTVIGPSASAPALYSSDAFGTLSVVQTTIANSVGSKVLNLTADATSSTDYMSSVNGSGNGFQSRKINGPHAILDPIPVSAAAASIATGTCTSCPYSISWTASDNTTQAASTGTSPFFYQTSAAGTSVGFGMIYRVIAQPYSQVFRLYLAAGANNQTQVCTGSLSDNSHSPVSTPGIVTAGSTYFFQEWTFASKVVGAVLSVYCRNTVSLGAGVTGVSWFAQTLSPT